MSIAQLIREMSALGAPADAIALAVEAIEAAHAKVEEKRAVERDRKRRQRAKAQDMDGTVTGRSRDMDGTVTDNPSLSLPPNENNSNPPTHTHPECVSTRTRKAEPFPKPDWADSQVWADLKANRKAKRLPNTPTAYAKFQRDIEQWVSAEWPPGRVLETIVARGWASAQYDPREGQSHGRINHQSVPKSAGSRGERRNPVLDMFLQSEAEIRAAEDQESHFDPGPTLRAIR